MPNLVPIQFLALFGYAILRFVVGLVWCHLALRHYSERHDILPTLNLPLIPFKRTSLFGIIVIEFICGFLFLIGLFTQVAAIITAIWCIKLLVLRFVFSHKSFPSGITAVLLLAISVTLFITGAGIPAFDLPI